MIILLGRSLDPLGVQAHRIFDAVQGRIAKKSQGWLFFYW